MWIIHQEVLVITCIRADISMTFSFFSQEVNTGKITKLTNSNSFPAVTDTLDSFTK